MDLLDVFWPNIGRLRDPVALEALIPLLRDPDGQVRDEALVAPGRRGDRR